MKKILFVGLMIILSGCAVGNKYDYRSSAISLPVKSTQSAKVAVSVDDQRPYVVAGEKGPNFVGLQRGGFGNPFDVTTASGKPLAEDMAFVLKKALEDSGYQIVETTSSSGNHKMFVLAAGDDGADKVVLLNIKEWKSDIYMGITLHSDIELTVYSVDGQVLANNTMKFEEGIGGAHIGASSNSQVIISEFSRRIGYLFNQEDIRKALRD